MLEEEDVQGPIDPKRNAPLIDLGTVRDTLAYIRDDLPARARPGARGGAYRLGAG